MSVNPVENQGLQPVEQKQSDKEYNFAQIRKQLEAERSARMHAEEKASQLMQQFTQQKAVDDDDHNDEPYVDHKRLEKKLAKFEASIDQKIDKKAEEKARNMFEEHKKQQWMKNNPDFYDVMQHTQKFAEKDPELAETILEMPDNFERQKLVYKNIKLLGLHQKEEPKPSIQETIDRNRRSPFYQPSGVGTAPYGVVNGGRNYSEAEGKNALAKMRELQSRLRLG